MLWHLHSGLPWAALNDESQVLQRKLSSESEGRIPSFLVPFMAACRALEFDELPQYEKLLALLTASCKQEVPQPTAIDSSYLHVSEDLENAMSPTDAFQAKRMPPSQTPIKAVSARSGGKGPIANAHARMSDVTGV